MHRRTRETGAPAGTDREVQAGARFDDGRTHRLRAWLDALGTNGHDPLPALARVLEAAAAARRPSARAQERPAARADGQDHTPKESLAKAQMPPDSGEMCEEISRWLAESPRPSAALAPIMAIAQKGAEGSHATPPAVADFVVRLALHRWLGRSVGGRPRGPGQDAGSARRSVAGSNPSWSKAAAPRPDGTERSPGSPDSRSTAALSRLVFEGVWSAADCGAAAEQRRAATLAALRDVRVLDPAAGGGVFLLAALEAIFQLRRALGDPAPAAAIARDILRRNLAGIEIDPGAAAIALGVLHLAVVRLGEQGDQPDEAGAGPCGEEDRPAPILVGDALSEGMLDGRAGIAARGRFDLVVMNPPYVRQEGIATGEKPPGQAIAGATKDQALALFQSLTGIRADGRSDLYVAFFALLPALLAPGGVAGLLTSTAWLDARYGEPLREAILAMGDVAIVEPMDERWFSGAAVNAGITLIAPAAEDVPGDRVGRSTRTSTSGADGEVQFVALDRDLLDIDSSARARVSLDLWPGATPGPDALERSHAFKDSLSPAGAGRTHRSLVVGRRALAHEPKWGQYLRTPALWLHALEEAGVGLVPLASVADVFYGVRTGCNDALVLRDVADRLDPDSVRQRFGVSGGQLAQQGLRIVVAHADWHTQEDPRAWHLLPGRALRPFVLHANDCTSVWVPPGAGSTWLLVATAQEDDPAVRAYIAWAQGRGLSASGRSPWWALAGRVRTGPLAYPDHHDRRALVLVNPSGVAVSNNFFVVETERERDALPLAGWLMSTPGMLERERVGRAALGQGGLKTDGTDIRLIRMPRLERLAPSTRRGLLEAVNALCRVQCDSLLAPDAPGPRVALDAAACQWAALAVEPALLRETLRQAIARRIARAGRTLRQSAGSPRRMDRVTGAPSV